MKTRDIQFRLLATTVMLNRCPFCGYETGLWQRTEDDDVSKVVMCSNSGDEDPSGDECPLFMPPETFYHATRREAVEYWQARTSRSPAASAQT